MAGTRSNIIFAFFVAVVLYAAWQVRDALLLIYVSALFAVILSPIIEHIRRIRIGRWRPGRGAAIVILFVGLAVVIGLFFAVAVPPIGRDLRQLAQEWPQRVQALSEKLHHLPFVDRLNINADTMRERLTVLIGSLAGGAAGVLTGIASGVGRFFTFLILMAYFILDGERTFRWGVSLFPVAHQARLANTLQRARDRISRWLLGQLTLMIILGVGCAIVFGLMHIRYFYVLAVIAGVANFVPMIGPIVTVILASAVAAIDSFPKVLGVIAFYAIYQQTESAFLTPRIMKSTVDLPGSAVLVALAIGGEVAGLVGALVAVPTAALAAVLIDEYLVKKPVRAETA
jgi:predicted PurR-regulated permease PerM